MMIKKVISILAVLMAFSVAGFAQRNEWRDVNYDFSGAKRVYIKLDIPPNLVNGITDRRIWDGYGKVLKKDFTDKIRSKGFTFVQVYDIITEIENETGEKFENLENTYPAKAEALFNEKVENKADIMLAAAVLAYGVGSEFREGYYMSLPSTQTSTVVTPNGIGTVYTNGTVQQYVPSRNVPVAYACVRFDVVDIATGRPVWSRIDDRAKANATVFDNTKPMDLFSRIAHAYFKDLVNVLSEK